MLVCRGAARDFSGQVNFQFSHLFFFRKMTTVIIDNGSHTIRIGYANHKPIAFRNAIFTSRDGRQRMGKLGEDCSGTETSPFERNVIVDFDSQQKIISVAMQECGIATLEDMNCVFTTPPMTPSFSLSNVAELLFETKRVKRLSLDSDFWFSYQFNNSSDSEYQMIVDIGYHATHLISVCKGQRKVIMRVPFGSFHSNAYLRERLLLKTSHLKSTLTRQYVETKREELCFVAKHLRERLRNIQQSDRSGGDTEGDATSLNSCIIVQLPFEKNSSTCVLLLRVIISPLYSLYNSLQARQHKVKK